MKLEITSHEQLLGLSPCEDREVLEYIDEINLTSFVDSDWIMYFRKESGEKDPSYMRVLQELLGIIKEKSGGRVVRHCGVTASIWDSFEEARGVNKEGVVETLVEGENVNEKIEALLGKMIELNASDLHIRLSKIQKLAMVRMRVKGFMVDVETWSYKVGRAVLRAIWVAYGSKDRKEGKINNGSFYYRPAEDSSREFLVRMTEAKESRGTKFVARMRDPEEIRPLDGIGYNDQQMSVVDSVLRARSGVVMFNGPTNSGKSTSLSSLLALFTSELIIVEIGDPVETTQGHIDHFELTDSHPGGKDGHLDELLATTVRMDPDVLVMTEMRDPRTSKACSQMASQGKLVMTTMHCTNFVSTFPRLVMIGIKKEDAVMPGFVRGVICQKLLPKLCPECSVETGKRTGSRLHYRELLGEGNIRFRNEEGCEACGNLGVIDRVIVAEAVEVNNAVLPLIHQIIYEGKLEGYFEYQQKKGILNTHQHARERILNGEVDPEVAERDLGPFGRENLLWLHPKWDNKLVFPRVVS